MWAANISGEYDGFPTHELERFLHHTFNHPATTAAPPNDDTDIVALAIPSAVATLTRMTNTDIGEFASRCHTTFRDLTEATA